MPVAPTYPGVYIEEIPSGVRSIAGVATSIAAFVDRFRRGPLNEAVRIQSFADFEREFGGLEVLSEASYGISQMFLNGGTEAYVVRVGNGTATAGVVLTAGLGQIVRATAGRRIRGESVDNPGFWGNFLRVDIDYGTMDPNEILDPEGVQTAAEMFNLTITETFLQGGRNQVRQTETFGNLTLHPGARNNAVEVVNAGSRLVQLDRQGLDPDPGDFADFRPSTTGTLGAELQFPVVPDGSTLDLSLDPGGGGAVSAHTATLDYGGDVPEDYEAFLTHLEAAIQTAEPVVPGPTDPLLATATAALGDDDRFRILLADAADNGATLTVSGATADLLGLSVGQGAVVGAQHPGTLGEVLGGVPGAIDGTTFVASLSPGGGAAAVDHDATINFGGPPPGDLGGLRGFVEDAIRSAVPGDPLLATATVELTSDDRYRVLLPDAAAEDATVEFSDTTADALELSIGAGATVGPQVLGTVGAALAPALQLTIPDGSTFDMTINPGGGGAALPAATVTLDFGAASPASFAELLPILRNAIRAVDANNPLISGASVQRVRNRYLVRLGRNGPDFNADATVTFTGATADALGLTAGAGAVVNVQQFALAGGDDGAMPGDADLRGVRANRTGMYALEDVDLFNLLCLPRAADLDGNGMRAVYSEAETYCEERRAFLLIDIPQATASVDAMETWLDDNENLRHNNAAVYFPRVRVADPLNQNRLRSIGASGTMAGVCARTDANRGVWKAPAGTDDGRLRGVQELAFNMTDAQNGVLNPLGVNGLRNFPVFSNLAWGARTLNGADQQASEWKYIPVRRFALFLEESLFRGTKWVVFEPNDEPLWAQIRLNLGAFMQRLFRQGAFQGQTAKEAYLVKCDSETTTQADIDLGIVNIVVGFAPLKPAEFVIIRIQQLAGQIPT